ncbi:hypothetical protein GCM10011611_20200 [Aliidongia dinghuensis]|uniref:Fatty acid hydroxylase domain-containing protein n=1 Tax=Aliidongia dinghuensis TaxID=1867774 RepID=A0A8J2YS74_9PROT|nr:sterol desaturase family protein [Aliidongia dinghuensis]GGF14367.1 hypothetical protein GCM10011611_20200 [Aliidongia dinghuensis]
MSALLEALPGLAMIGLMCVVAVAIECGGNVDRQRHCRAAAFNLAYYFTTTAALAPVMSIAASGVAVSLNSIGGGLVALPAGGWWFPANVLAILLVTDFLEYSYHYAQHKVPLLWRMHSLHHSEEQINATTTTRQFWFDQIIRAMVILPIVGLAIRTDASVVVVARMLVVANGIHVHMSLQRGWGRLWWLLNSPQYHRCHHSFLPQHIDRNLAPMFPIWDILFGTAYRAAADEYPPTGLQPSVRPSLLGAVLWPLRAGASGR